MLDTFNSFIREKKLCKPGQKILLAVSGGVDSMVMAELFHQSGYTFGVAHLNHSLRGQSSDDDELFVKNFCLERGITFHSQKIDISALSKIKKENVQAMARKERYDWFSILCEEHLYDHIATAHHKNDEIETFLLNFSRQAGLRGLSGIPVKRDNIIRPLLFTFRNEIEEYAKRNNIHFREDQSNSNIKYSRNYIRHEVIPVLRKLNPDFNQNAASSIDHMKDSNELFEYLLLQYTSPFIKIVDSNIHIKQSLFDGYHQPEVLAFEILRQYGFNANQCKDLIQNNQTGNIFYSHQCRALVNRDEIIIEKNHPTISCFYQIKETTTIPEWGTITMEKSERPLVFENEKNIAFLDFDKLHFPLVIRNWSPGDHFKPLGISGSQKVKEFLINEKLDRFQKEKVLVLCSKDEICWIVGHRISEEFKITDQTKDVVKLSWN